MNKTYPEITPANIWNFRQNNPELIIKDAAKYLGLDDNDCELLRQILLARGVNKWLKVRRDLIAYKKQVKNELKQIETERVALKSYLREERDERLYHHYLALKGITKTLQGVRAQLRALCNTDRWQIWPRLNSHHKELKAMNSLFASD